MTYICSYTPLLQKHERNKSLSHTSVAVRVWVADWCSLFLLHVFIRLEKRWCLGNREELWARDEDLFRVLSSKGGKKAQAAICYYRWTKTPLSTEVQYGTTGWPHARPESESTEPKTRLQVFAACLWVTVADTSGPVPPSGVHGRKGPPSRAETASVHTLLVAVKLLRSQWKAIPSSLTKSKGSLF